MKNFPVVYIDHIPVRVSSRRGLNAFCKPASFGRYSIEMTKAMLGEPEEIQRAVIAHEMGHATHNHGHEMLEQFGCVIETMLEGVAKARQKKDWIGILRVIRKYLKDFAAVRSLEEELGREVEADLYAVAHGHKDGLCRFLRKIEKKIFLLPAVRKQLRTRIANLENLS